MRCHGGGGGGDIQGLFHAPWLHPESHLAVPIPFLLLCLLKLASPLFFFLPSLLPSFFLPTFFSFLFWRQYLSVLNAQQEEKTQEDPRRSSNNLQLTQSLLWAMHTWTHWLLLTRTNVCHDQLHLKKQRRAEAPEAHVGHWQTIQPLLIQHGTISLGADVGCSLSVPYGGCYVFWASLLSSNRGTPTHSKQKW